MDKAAFNERRTLLEGKLNTVTDKETHKSSYMEHSTLWSKDMGLQ